MRHAIFLSTIVAMAISGHAAEPPSAPATTILEPVFDCYHANSAWGFTLSGKVVDNQGKIWSYGKHGQAWQPALVKEGNILYVSAKDLQAKYSQPKEAGSVDAKALQDNSELIAKAGKATLTHADTGVRDAGTSVCHAYIHDQANQRYQDIDLGSDDGVSDRRTSNSAPEAQLLLTWLKSVGVAK